MRNTTMTEVSEDEIIRKAVIDVGTVTARLLIADCKGLQIKELKKLSSITHLGAKVAETGKLSDEGLLNLKQALDEFLSEISACGIDSKAYGDNVIAIATSASRDASNSDEVEKIFESAGIKLNIIDGDTEAKLSFAGATYCVDEDCVMVADPGGGSTEIIIGKPYVGSVEGLENLSLHSFDVGCRRITDLFFDDDPPSSSSIKKAIDWSSEHFDKFFSKVHMRPQRTIGVAGTITSIVAIRDKLDPYDPKKVHGSIVTCDEVRQILDELSELSLDQRKQVVGLQPPRASVIIGGLAIVLALLETSGNKSLTVSESDNLLGTLLVWPALSA